MLEIMKNFAGRLKTYTLRWIDPPPPPEYTPPPCWVEWKQDSPGAALRRIWKDF